MATAEWSYTYLRTPTDRLWFDEALRKGWKLPPPARPLMRRWGVRHCRCLWRLMEDTYWNWRWAQLGLYPSGYNDWLRYAVMRGWA